MKCPWISLVCILPAMAASADELTGTISNIDLNRMTFEVEGKTFTASPTNTVGAKLSDLMEGDEVTIEVTECPPDWGDCLDPTTGNRTGAQSINVMRLEKSE